jgi:hypothetical protein
VKCVNQCPHSGSPADLSRGLESGNPATISGDWSCSRKRIVKRGRPGSTLSLFRALRLRSGSSHESVGLVQLLQFFVKAFDGTE